MQKILILGSGRSSTSLTNYLLNHSHIEDWQITIADKKTTSVREKIKNHKRAIATTIDVADDHRLADLIQQHDLVISMLPTFLHLEVAKKCAIMGKHLLTASYLSPEIRKLEKEFENKGKILIMEMGLDPGIDHMSAMKVLDRIKESGHELTAFETFTGGLLAQNDKKDNPWQYKFTWNPKNVVTAGQGIVKFIQEGRYKYIPYNRVFRRTEIMHIPDYGYFEGYANRDSLKYLDLYGLRGIQTLYRGTLRRPGFCQAWNIFVQIGATDDSYEMENVGKMTHRQFINSFLSYNPNDSIELKLAHYMNLDMESEIMYKIRWLGIFSEELIGLEKGTPAQILEHILRKKWTLDASDQDMVVMWHKFNYIEKGDAKQIESHMIAMGENETETAMSKTVGLPLSIAAKLILQGKINLNGVHIPTHKQIYEPVLKELKELGLKFSEQEISLNNVFSNH